MKLKNLLPIVLFLLPMVLFGQDTIYIDKYNDVTKLKILANTYQFTRPDSPVKDGKIVTEYYLSGKIKSEYHMVTVVMPESEEKKDVWEGSFKMWYESGQIKRDSYYHLNKVDGNFTTYWENGKVKRHELFKDQNHVEGKCFNENGHETAYYPFHKMAEFPGGEKIMLMLISKTLKYPDDAQKARIQGKVVVVFVVDTLGQVNDIHLKKEFYPSMDKEALRVISLLPRWIPAETDGEKVIEWYSLPITFKL